MRAASSANGSRHQDDEEHRDREFAEPAEDHSDEHGVQSASATYCRAVGAFARVVSPTRAHELMPANAAR